MPLRLQDSKGHKEMIINCLKLVILCVLCLCGKIILFEADSIIIFLIQRLIKQYNDENLFFKDDDAHVFIDAKNSVAILPIINKLENEIFANQFILSIIKICL